MLELSVLFADNNSVNDSSNNNSVSNSNKHLINGTVDSIHTNSSSNHSSNNNSFIGRFGSSINGVSANNAVLLFDSEQGCSLVRQFLELAQVVAVSTPASSLTAHTQTVITQR